MPIKNYTTKVPALQTIGEIQGILATHGAQKIMLEYEDAHVKSVCFSISTTFGVQAFQIPARVDGVAATLAKQKVKCDYETAERVAWRIVKDWIDAQMAFLESGQAAMDEIFLPYMVDRTGETLYQSLSTNKLKLLPTDEDC